MPAAPEFTSLIVSRRRPYPRYLSRLRVLALTAGLYAAGAVAIVLAPFLVLEVMRPPNAGSGPDINIVFHPPGRMGGRPGSTGNRKGGGGAKSAPAAAPARPNLQPVPQPDDLLAPPAPAGPASSGPEDGGTGPGEPGGPGGGDGPDDGGDGDCVDCTGTGTGVPGGPDGPYEPGAEGLIPPVLIPGSRALPRYPDLARRAALQGTVILLAVVEKDGTIGVIEVVKSPDQRWGFDLAAIDAVRQWRYRPALMNGAPVAAYIQVMVEFTLAR